MWWNNTTPGCGPAPSGRARYASIWSPSCPLILTVSAINPSYGMSTSCILLTINCVWICLAFAGYYWRQYVSNRVRNSHDYFSKTVLPPSIVRSTGMSFIVFGSTVLGSSDKMTKSASLPSVIEPLIFSSKDA